MKNLSFQMRWLVLAMGTLAAAAAWADRGAFEHRRPHSYTGVLMSHPTFGGPRHRHGVAPAFAFPQVIVVRDTSACAQQAAAPVVQPAYWHYCTDPAGYYPHVADCPAGWQPVAPVPPPQ